MRGEGIEKFGPNSGRFVGWLTMIFVGAGAAVALADGWHDSDPAVLAALAVVALLAWAVLLRPAMYTDGEELELRNPFQSVFIPLAAVEGADSRLVFVVMTHDEVFRSTAVTTKRRDLFEQARGARSAPIVPNRGVGPMQDPNMGLASQGSFVDATAANYGKLVEDRILHLADEARAKRLPVTDVRRALAWPVLTALAVLTVLGVVFGFLV